MDDEFISSNEFVNVPKNVYVLNALANGISLQMLSKVTGERIEAWKDFIGLKAVEQYKQLSNQQIQEIIDSDKNNDK